MLAIASATGISLSLLAITAVLLLVIVIQWRRLSDWREGCQQAQLRADQLERFARQYFKDAVLWWLRKQPQVGHSPEQIADALGIPRQFLAPVFPELVLEGRIAPGAGAFDSINYWITGH
jgi:hypothetical protein